VALEVPQLQELAQFLTYHLLMEEGQLNLKNKLK
tara:strand:+ start:202 stop:303 length:102 start_codon:yes stop_codon:yes gene_type:complete